MMALLAPLAWPALVLPAQVLIALILPALPWPAWVSQNFRQAGQWVTERAIMIDNLHSSQCVLVLYK